MFYGSIRNSIADGVGGAVQGWLMKLPLSICFEGAYCSGDTLSLHTILTSTHDISKDQYQALKLHPNPISAGQSIHLSGMSSTGLSGDVQLRMLDIQGRVVHESSLSGADLTDVVRWELPSTLSTGMYYIEVITSGGNIAGGKVMVE